MASLKQRHENAHQDKMQTMKKKKGKVPSNTKVKAYLFCMYQCEELKRMKSKRIDSPKANSHCSFPSDLSGTTSRSSIGKFVGAAHLLKTQWGSPQRDPSLPASPPLTVSQLSPTVFLKTARINSYLCPCRWLGPPDSWMWASNGVSI